MRADILCPMCTWRASVPSPSLGVALYLVHWIDDHWDLVERIHATTGDGPARLALVGEMGG